MNKYIQILYLSMALGQVALPHAVAKSGDKDHPEPPAKKARNTAAPTAVLEQQALAALNSQLQGISLSGSSVMYKSSASFLAEGSISAPVKNTRDSANTLFKKLERDTNLSGYLAGLNAANQANALDAIETILKRFPDNAIHDLALDKDLIQLVAARKTASSVFRNTHGSDWEIALANYLGLFQKYKGKPNMKVFLNSLPESTSASLVKKLTDLPTSVITKLEDDIASVGVIFKANPGTIKAWETAIKHSKVRTSVSALTKIDNILSNGRIPVAKLKAAIDGNLGDILNAGDATNLGKILDRLNLQHVNEAHFDEILQRLSNYPTLKQDLITNPQWFETFDDILKEPGKYWDILSEGNLPSGSALSQWGQGFWWKNLRELADQFEGSAALTSFISTNGIAFNKVVQQVTLEVNGIKIRIDYLGVDGAGKFHLGDAKFSTKPKNWISDWLNSATDNQTVVFPLFQNGGVNNIVVKATDPAKIADLVKIGLGNNSTISFSNTTLKIFGSEANQQAVKSVVTIKN
jgi:hypothetical protein